MKVIGIHDLSAARPYERLVTMVAVVESPGPPTPEEIMAISRYHPSGYDCYSAKVEEVQGRAALWTVTWRRTRTQG